MNADDLARRCVKRLLPEIVSPEIVSPDDLGDLFQTMVYECWPEYQQRVERWHAELANWEERLRAGRDYPGVVQSIEAHVRDLKKMIAVWEALHNPDTAEIEAAMAMPGDDGQWRREIFKGCTAEFRDHPANRAYVEARAQERAQRGEYAMFWPQ